jgi:hypothetical protein
LSSAGDGGTILDGVSARWGGIVDESIFREVNLRIHALTRAWGVRSDYVCECGHVTCRAVLLALSPEDFAQALALSGARLVAPGHQTPGTRVVLKTRRYLIVSPTNEAGGRADAA